MIRLFKKLASALQVQHTTPTRIFVDEESIQLFQGVIGKCEVSLLESKKHLAKVIAKRIFTKREFVKLQEIISSKREAIQIKREQGDIVTARKLATELLMFEKSQQDNQLHLTELEHHERNTQLVLQNTAKTLGHYRNELHIAKTANMRDVSSNAPELSSESIIKMQQSLNRLRSRQNNPNTIFG